MIGPIHLPRIKILSLVIALPLPLGFDCKAAENFMIFKID